MNKQSLTKQEIFNTVYDWFVTKGNFQSITGTRCFYRGLNNSCCAVGCLLPDDLYKPAMEQKTIHDLYFYFDEVKEYFGEDNVDFLEELQIAHDNLGNSWPRGNETFREKLVNIAGKYNLKVSNE